NPGSGPGASHRDRECDQVAGSTGEFLLREGRLNMEVIYGPTAPSAGGVMYQVTLASGVIVTSPDGFANGHREVESREAVVSERGRVLRRPEHLASEVVRPV